MTPPTLTLDHVAVIIGDLDAAEAAYEALGFTLTPRSSHKGPVEPGGAVQPWGSGNHCAMFHQGYFEILGITDPARYHAHIDARLARYEGLHLIALGSADASAVVDDLRGRGLAARDVLDLQRDVPYDGGTRLGRFRIVYPPEGAFDAAELIYIEHATPEVLWQPALLDHPNRVRALASVTVCAADPAAAVARLEALTGHKAHDVDGGWGLPLTPGGLEVASAALLDERYPGATVPRAPSVAAVTFATDDLGAVRRCLDASSVAYHEGRDGAVWVGPQAAAGAIVEFVAA